MRDTFIYINKIPPNQSANVILLIIQNGDIAYNIPLAQSSSTNHIPGSGQV